MKITVHEPLEFEVLAEGQGFTEGPVVCADGTVYAVDIDGARILHVTDGVTTVVATPGGGPNGLALETPTTAIVANNGGFRWGELGPGMRFPVDWETHSNEPDGFAGGWIERVDLSSGDVTVLHRTCEGRPFRGPNDLVFDQAGGLWFTDHGKMRHDDVDRCGLYYVPPDGSTVRQVAYPLLGPNGVGLSPDGRRVYAAETHTGRLWAWDLAGPGEVVPVAGSLAPGGGVCVVATPFAFDSLAVEEDGRVVIGALPDGLVAVTPDGAEVDVYPVPGDATTNIAFGGADGRRAVVTLSLTGRIVETSWPRPGLVVGPARP